MTKFYSWQLLNSSLPIQMNKKDGIAGCVLNNKMYALGGWKSGGGWNNLGVSNNNVSFSLDGINWTLSAKTPTWDGRHNFPAVVHNNRIYVVGGDLNSGSYQPNVHSWSGLETEDWVVEATDVPWGNRAGHFAFSLGDYIWVGFGQTFTQLTAPPTTYFTDLWRSLDGKDWELFTDKAPCSYRGFLCNNPPIIDGEAFFIGGGTYDTTDFPTREYKNDVYAMDENGNFRLVNSGKPSVLNKLMYHSIIELDGSLFVLGGYNAADQSKVFRSDDKAITWVQMPSPPWAARHAALAIKFNEELYFGTGMNATDIWKLKTSVFPENVNVGALPDGITALSSIYTVIDKSTQLIAGKTVAEIGYFRNSPGAMTPKILKQIGSSNVFDVVWSGSTVVHAGGGYQSFDIPDFIVPNDGNTYRIAFAFSYPSADLYAAAGAGRWLKAGNITGLGQTFSYYSDGSCCMTWTEA